MDDTEYTEYRTLMLAVNDLPELSPKAKVFVLDRRVREKKYGVRMVLSAAQWKWLRDPAATNEPTTSETT